MAAFIGKGYQFHKLNKQQLTARDQNAILEQAGFTKKDIKQIKSSVEQSGQDVGFMNSGKRISFGKMRQILKKHDPDMADKARLGLNNYKKTFKHISDEETAAEQKTAKIKANIDRTRKYDQKRERGDEYMREKLAEQKLKGLEGKASDHRSKGQTEYHTLKGPDTSVARWTKKDAEGKDHETSAQTDKRKTDSFNKLKERANNLPDLPI